MKPKDSFRVYSYTVKPAVRTHSGQRDNTLKANNRKPRWLDTKRESNYDTYNFMVIVNMT